MKILVIVPFLPNTSTSGGQTRWYNIIKYLSKKHDITLFSLIKHESEKKYLPELNKYCRDIKIFYRPKSPWTVQNIFLAELGPYPLVVIRNLSLKERRAIKEELKKGDYDIVHAEAFYVMPHIPDTNVPNILVEQTIEYKVYKHYVDKEVPIYLRPFFYLDVAKLKYWERHFWKKADQLVAVSEDDMVVMKKDIPGIDVDIIPNGVDYGHFSKPIYNKLEPPRVLYGVSNFEWLQNVEAANLLIHKVWPGIKKKVPKAKAWIVGRNIPEQIVKLSKEREDIEITESIDDPREAYQSATIMVTPIKGGGGTRLKILEAMAAGLPIVSTSVGVSGLKLTDGNQVFIADTDKGLIDKAVRLLSNPKEAAMVGKAGQQFVKRNYDWVEVVKLHDDIYKKAIRKKSKK